MHLANPISPSAKNIGTIGLIAHIPDKWCIRVGTPAITTRGVRPEEVKKIVHLMDEVLSTLQGTRKYSRVENQVREMMSPNHYLLGKLAT